MSQAKLLIMRPRQISVKVIQLAKRPVVIPIQLRRAA